MATATLTISSRNYSSWSLRGWLICKMAGLDFETEVLPGGDETSRAELLHLSPSFLVPRLHHEGIVVWDTLAIAQYLNETFPEAGFLPKDAAARAHCRSISGEMHGGFINLRSALPMNLKAFHPRFRVFNGARGDIERIVTIFDDCLARYEGPFLFGERPTLADAMYAPVCTRFRTYDVTLPPRATAYRDAILHWPLMVEWAEAAAEEPEEIEELDMEF
ncbi:glutathione S-transferase family protein [Methylobacterium sp. E-041]|jgi:glutathione S-transferase|uniref:glutathione S-transferase family protein n=1 Tax=unclassified Methylobacterium TaxID=2615210 RepID=UPI0011C82668|nr:MULTISPECIES: glutathione S-transferase family protein [unclassified Methylobacterium]MCJ2008360.1 glutathione S-transferase family protein [Methylobacterium sp. J-092]MCJ2041164.1 glutathione S-transferase family protein [Methylobacterium sp. J-059]MCJ2075800.1 glutathione S-transferase family protein [Methylobacterium sp. E-016]MCJ2104165.1 glutathione S-transferase family protein [Methylobacterium sp. E-041]MCJ2114057.1 glutathione S-transferase family protein [Methylobacterium sp. E-025